MSTLNVTTINATTLNALSKPNNPAFQVERVYGATSNFISGNTTQILTWNSIRLNRGNHYSSGAFTAPITGIYIFTFHITFNNAGQLSDFGFCRNNSLISEVVTAKTISTNIWENAALVAHINLNQNEFVTVGTVAYEGNNGTCRATFGGSLIG